MQQNRVVARGLRNLCLLLSLAGVTVVARAGLFDEKPTSSQTNPPQPPTGTASPSSATPAPAPDAEPPPPARVSVQPDAGSTAMEPAKLPIPSDEQLQAAEKQVQEVLGQQLLGAKTPAEKVKLARDLLPIADGTAEAAEKFTLLRKAEDLAADAGALAETLQSHQALTSIFDSAGSTFSLDVYQRLARFTFAGADAERMSESIVTDANAALVAGRYETARQLARLATGAARRLNDKALNDRIAALLSNISATETEQKRIAPSLAVLAKNPADPSANQAVGAFRCFFKQDWAGGLPLLVKGSDPRLRDIVTRELGAASNPNQQMLLGDLWWNYGESQPLVAKNAIRLHAGKFYSQAAPGLTGLVKLKAEQRSADYLKTASQAPAVASTPAARSPAANSGTSSPLSTDEFTSIEQMLRSLDQSLFPDTIAGWTYTRQQAVNAALRSQVAQRQATLVLTMQTIERGSISVNIDSRQIKLGQFLARVHASFGSEHLIATQALREGQPHAISGRILSAAFDGTVLWISLYDCHLPGEPAGNPGSGPSLTTGTQTPPAPTQGTLPRPAGQPDFSSQKEIADVLPLDLLPAEWSDHDAVSRYMAAVRSKVINRGLTAEFQVTMVDTQMRKTTGVLTQFLVGKVTVNLRFTFDAADPQVEGIQSGETVVLYGQFGEGFGFSSASLSLNLKNCRIIRRPSVPSPALIASEPKPALEPPLTDVQHADFGSTEAVMAVFPFDSVPPPETQRAPGMYKTYWEQCRKVYKEKTIYCRVTVSAVDTTFRNVTSVSCTAPPAGRARVSLLFGIPINDPLLAKVSVGQSIVITGRFNGSVSGSPQHTTLYLDHCRIAG